ncbi:hypothetical protein [Paenibacillus sp. L3-i20]|uniref:hypothetical protein n=1 Tax=Paenibacillus sp. L3-i20 TaxID=2905833 RepID=UPI001EDEA027|nr:hypothetical protein [Paenibacillus sp. L3-i20]GKU79553.1 hypothetical protein L3i20_v239500 [Paenibacillus sp. L3-i20]
MREDSTIRAALASIIEAAGSDRWMLGGSAGLLLRGIGLPSGPRDIDLYCDDADIPFVHHALQQYAIDEPEISVTDIYRSTLSHYLIENYRVELVGGFQITAHGCLYRTEVNRVLRRYGLSLDVGNIEMKRVVHIVPLAHELWFNALRNRVDRVQLISSAIRIAPGKHEAAFALIEESNNFPKNTINHVHSWIDDQKEGELEWTLKYSSGHPVGQSE